MNKQIYFTLEVWEKLTEEAKKMGLSRSSYIRMILLEKWKQQEKGE